jgi:hypothetical protein
MANSRPPPSDDERGAGTDEDNRAGVMILRSAGHSGLDGFGNTSAQGIDWRVVNGEDGDVIAQFVVDEVGHGVLISYRGRREVLYWR